MATTTAGAASRPGPAPAPGPRLRPAAPLSGRANHADCSPRWPPRGGGRRAAALARRGLTSGRRGTRTTTQKTPRGGRRVQPSRGLIRTADGPTAADGVKVRAATQCAGVPGGGVSGRREGMSCFSRWSAAPAPRCSISAASTSSPARERRLSVGGLARSGWSQRRRRNLAGHAGRAGGRATRLATRHRRLAVQVAQECRPHARRPAVRVPWTSAHTAAAPTEPSRGGSPPRGRPSPPTLERAAEPAPASRAPPVRRAEAAARRDSIAAGAHRVGEAGLRRPRPAAAERRMDSACEAL